MSWVKASFQVCFWKPNEATIGIWLKFHNGLIVSLTLGIWYVYLPMYVWLCILRRSNFSVTYSQFKHYTTQGGFNSVS